MVQRARADGCNIPRNVVANVAAVTVTLSLAHAPRSSPCPATCSGLAYPTTRCRPYTPSGINWPDTGSALTAKSGIIKQFLLMPSGGGRGILPSTQSNTAIAWASTARLMSLILRRSTQMRDIRKFILWTPIEIQNIGPTGVYSR
jgi:hypothetical protein